MILLADLEANLFPLTNDSPKGLLPIVNRPLLKYQLDLLAASKFHGKITTKPPTLVDTMGR